MSKTASGMEKVDVYQLFKRNKIIRIEDDQHRFAEVEIRKPTWKIRDQALEIYRRVRQQSLDSFDSVTMSIFQQETSRMTDEDMVAGILNQREAERRPYLDLLPIEDEQHADADTRKAKQDEALAEWREKTLSALQGQERAELEREMIRILLDQKAALIGVQASNFYQLSEICFNPGTGDKVFESPKSVEELNDPEMVNYLVEEMSRLDAVSSDRRNGTRTVAEDPSFLESGQSAKRSTRYRRSKE